MSQSYDWTKASQLRGEVDKLASIVREMESITSARLGELYDSRTERDPYDPKLEQLKQRFREQFIQVHILAP
jgi:hypothetical protein